MATCLPYKKENGAPGSIAEQTVDHRVNVVLGGGKQRFDQRIVPVPGNETAGRPGALSTLLTKGDQSLMTINYATRPHLQSQDHTGSEVRIAAQGPQAANVIGVTNQTDLFHTMARALGLE